MKSISDSLYQIGFLITVIALGIIYFLYDKRGRKIEQVVYDLQKQKLESKLASLKEEAQNDSKKSEKAARQYGDLVRRYMPLMHRLGIQYNPGPLIKTTPKD